MSFKQLRHILIFLVLTIGLHLLFRFMGWPGSLGLLAFIPLVYVLIHLISAIVKLVKRKWESALISFTIAFLFALFFNKIYYVYYNIAVTIVFLFLAWLVTKRVSKDSNEKIRAKRITLASLLIINVLLLFIPDKLILTYLVSNSEVTWRQLTWDYFKGEPDKTSIHSAQTASTLHYKSNGAFNYPPVIVFAAMNPENSWVKNIDSLNESSNKALLKHEQGHFDITELYARKADDSARTNWGKTEKNLDEVISYWDEQLDKMQDIYDNATKHGVNDAQQHMWTSAIQDMLSQKQAQNPSLLIALVKKENETRTAYQNYIILLLKDLKVSTNKVNLLIHSLSIDINTGRVNIHNNTSDTLIAKYSDLYKQSLPALDSSIELVSALPEKDDSIRLKSIVSNLLIDSKKMMQGVIPWIIDILKIGIDNASPEQKKAFAPLREQIKDIKTRNDKFVSTADSFIVKHNIDRDVLDSAGVMQNDSTSH